MALCFLGKMRQNVGQSWVLLPPRRWHRMLLGGGMARGWTEPAKGSRGDAKDAGPMSPTASPLSV